jgi:NAD(P)-dependent dehydrogenase (short-subunit alcohol dehydrogenase family)
MATDAGLRGDPAVPSSETFANGIKTVLITGAAYRIGRAIALSFADRGWQVVIHYRSSADAAETLAEDIRRAGGKAVTLDADLADAGAVRSLLPRCAERAGPPCCLINNASIYLNDELCSLEDRSWQAHMDVNLRAPLLLAQSFAGLLPAGAEGNIVNIIDQRVLKPSPEFFSYAISKSALWWATQTMAQALAPAIRVNAVAPGPVLPSIHQTQDDFHAEERATLLQRSASPDEIANAVHFLLQTPSITGQMICVDAGQHLAG